MFVNKIDVRSYLVLLSANTERRQLHNPIEVLEVFQFLAFHIFERHFLGEAASILSSNWYVDA